jgi:hypothetical protein
VNQVHNHIAMLSGSYASFGLERDAAGQALDRARTGRRQYDEHHLHRPYDDIKVAYVLLMLVFDRLLCCTVPERWLS